MAAENCALVLDWLPAINSGWWAATCSRSQQSLGYVSTHPHPEGFSIAEYSPSPLLALIASSDIHLTFVVPLSSCGLLFSGTEQQWPTSLRCVCPYLATRLRSILSCLGTMTKYGLETPSLTESWTYLSSLRAHCAMHFSSSTDRSLWGNVMAAEVTWLPLLDCDM